LDAFWRIRGFLAEGREWFARLLDVVPIDLRTRLRARGLYAAALFAILQGDYAAGKGLLQESLIIFREIDDSRNVAYTLDALAYLAIEQGEYPEAEARAREAVDLLRARSSREGLASPHPSRDRATLARRLGCGARVVRAVTRDGARARNTVGNRNRS
jgi:tetratricopeptide (TPR) repeat protein